MISYSRVGKGFSKACLVLLGASLVGCTSSVTLPLCPRIAANSYASVDKSAVVNRYILEQAKKRNLKISILSSYVAEFVGASKDIRWLKANYKTMLCAFNPLLEIDDKTTYLSCMAHADRWITLVIDGNAERLMLTDTVFHENCTTSPVMISRRSNNAR